MTRQQQLRDLAFLTVFSVGTYFFVRWRLSRRKQRKQLEKDLDQAKRTVRDLENKLLTLEQNDINDESGKPKKEVRIWMDGAFDMMHYGHMNAFRQAKALGTVLIAGVNSDETITQCKGKPVCSEAERIATVRGCKFVDEVVEGVPYVLNDELLNYYVSKYNIDYVVHGDDPCIVDGKNVYESAIKAGKYLTIPRTEGISTTDIVGRMLLMTTAHHHSSDNAKGGQTISSYESRSLSNKEGGNDEDEDESEKQRMNAVEYDKILRKSHFLTTSRTIRLFGAGVKAPKPTDKVVYLAGSWDMFHAGHMEILEKAKQYGDYIIVGVHNDQTVNQRQGMNLPIMTLHERVLSVLGCKYVDDVLIDAPLVITQEMISSLKISVVLTATPKGENASTANNQNDEIFRLPKEMGILKEIAIDTRLTAMDFVTRIQEQQERYKARFEKKMLLEQDFYKTKYSL